MEARKITVVSSRENKRSTFMSSATTLGELKADLDANNISYTDMTFYEGISKVELISDDSLLPTNVVYKGTTTNELVFMLTQANKKIKSGCEVVRSEVYKMIKEKGLQAECTRRFGKHYTNCKTSDLMNLIEEFTPADNTHICVAEDVKQAVDLLLSALMDNEVISNYTFNTVKRVLHGQNVEVESTYSSEEIDNMFDFM
jgi:hypothetical protein